MQPVKVYLTGMEQSMANEGVMIKVDGDLGYGNYVDSH